VPRRDHVRAADECASAATGAHAHQRLPREAPEARLRPAHDAPPRDARQSARRVVRNRAVLKIEGQG
jgi:hypothetical protein